MMNKDVAGNLLKACLVAACLIAGGGCERGDAQPVADAATPAVAVDADADLLNDLEGVWATSDNTDNDDAETVYVIESEGDGKLRISRDGHALKVAVEDVDAVQGTVTVRHETDDGLVDTLTFRKKLDERDSERFNLRLVYGNGQADALGYVRRLSPADRKALAEAYVAPAEVMAEPGLDCSTATAFRARMLCQNADLREQDEKLGDYLYFIAHRGEINDADATRAAAMKQLDACNNRDCLHDVYAKWITYLEGNYDHLELSGMVE